MHTIGQASFFVEEIYGEVQTFFETDLEAFLFWFRKSESVEGKMKRWMSGAGQKTKL